MEAGSFGRRGSETLQEHELVYEKLPQDIHERHVLLLVSSLFFFINLRIKYIHQ